LSLVVALSAPVAFAQAPDNTRVNQSDRANSQSTADQAKNQKSDREIMQAIRKSVTSDKSLSSYGHNVKVISQNGSVTLEGPVRSEDERRNIEGKAMDVAGKDKVTNHLTVKPENESH
jgi:osmotically-inducible protein OsmY